MPITLTVRSSGGEARALTFDGPRIAIGRSDGCDVRLPDPSVSQRHASIRTQGADFAIVDEGSSNGTWVGGVKLNPQTPRLVRTGDLVRVGRVWLEVSVGHKPPTIDLALATRELALAIVRDAMNAAGDETVPRVRVVEGPDLGAELMLREEGRTYVIGRAERCDLPLADEDASREHCALMRQGAIVYVKDLRSHNGVFLGDMRVERDIAWRPAMSLKLARSVLSLEEPVSRALAELEAAQDEILSPEEQKPPEVTPPAPEVQAEAAPEPMPESSRGLAPIAAIDPGPSPAPTRKPKRVWTGVDIAVVSIAIVVIGTSLAGLVWVLK